MTITLPPRFPRTLGVAALLLSSWLAPGLTLAQCPAATSCTVGSATGTNATLGFGITNVTLGTINNMSGVGNGYQNLACSTLATQTATLTVGQNYTLTVRTALTENVRVWIDYNGDGTFSTINEQVLTSNNATVHTATVTPPAAPASVLGSRVRVRVSSDYSLGTLPTPCSTPQYSQVEDYSVTLVANTAAPVASFTTNKTTTCDGCVQFTDRSQNLPTGWSWNFGDGTPNSTVQNPQHCYTLPGTYSVTLTATNANGTNTSTATTITYNNQVPAAASCAPVTTNYCCGRGILNFRLGTINNTSLDGSVGYEDFTCSQRTQLTIGVPTTLTMTMGTTNTDTKVYLDQNNDGILTASEVVFTALSQTTTTVTTASFLVPGSTVTNTPLRLRVVSDGAGGSTTPCGTPSGQAEDYTVTVRPSTAPPVPAFTSNYVANQCQSTVQFTDQSTGGPTSWLWNFGDMTTSTLQNPSKTYTATGTYTVTLTTTNANGTNTATRTNYITVLIPCRIYCASNGTGTGMGGPGNPNSAMWITNVSVSAAPSGSAFSSTTSATAPEPGGYGDYSATRTATLQRGTTHTMSVTTNLAFPHRVTAWIDYNGDGIFSSTAVGGNPAEMVINGTTVGGPPPANAALYTATFTVPVGTNMASSTRMRVLASTSTTSPDPCAVNQINAEVEDYTVQLQPLAARLGQQLTTLNVYPNPSQDGYFNLALTEAPGAGRYSITVENLLGARVLETSCRLGAATSATLDLRTLPAGTYLLRLHNEDGQTALRRIVRQ